MCNQTSQSIPELAACISKKIEQVYLACTPAQQDFIRDTFNKENGTQLQNMNGDLYNWLRTQDPVGVLQHFKRLRGLIQMAQNIEASTRYSET